MTVDRAKDELDTEGRENGSRRRLFGLRLARTRSSSSATRSVSFPHSDCVFRAFGLSGESNLFVVEGERDP